MEPVSAESRSSFGESITILGRGGDVWSCDQLRLLNSHLRDHLFFSSTAGLNLQVDGLKT